MNPWVRPGGRVPERSCGAAPTVSAFSDGGLAAVPVDLGQFYGLNLLRGETSATSRGLDSLLDPHGSLKQAQKLAARAFGAQKSFFLTNRTSTANKIVHQSILPAMWSWWDKMLALTRGKVRGAAPEDAAAARSGEGPLSPGSRQEFRARRQVAASCPEGPRRGGTFCRSRQARVPPTAWSHTN